MATHEDEEDEEIEQPEQPEQPELNDKLMSLLTNKSIISEPTITKEQPLPDNPFQKLLNVFGDNINKIIKNQDEDRNQAEEAIKAIRDRTVQQLEEGDNAGLAPLLENWVQALRVKSDINANASRVLDSIAKLISAGKNNDVIVNVKSENSGGLDIMALLKQPKKEDEDE